MSRHSARKKNKEFVQRSTRHGDPVESIGREQQRQLATNTPPRVEGEQSRNGDHKGELMASIGREQGSYLTMASKYIVRRVKAA